MTKRVSDPCRSPALLLEWGKKELGRDEIGKRRNDARRAARCSDRLGVCARVIPSDGNWIPHSHSIKWPVRRGILGPFLYRAICYDNLNQNINIAFFFMGQPLRSDENKEKKKKGSPFLMQRDVYPALYINIAQLPSRSYSTVAAEEESRSYILHL